MKLWYAIYTRPKSEKKVALYLAERNIEAYLPVHRVKKKWSDRWKWVEEPLFKSYLFVSIDETEYYEVLNTLGVVRFITFNGKAASIRQDTIDFLKRLLDTDYEMEAVSSSLHVGDRIQIERGPLIGLKGTLVSFAGDKKVKVELENFEQALLITVPMHFLQPTLETKHS